MLGYFDRSSGSESGKRMRFLDQLLPSPSPNQEEAASNQPGALLREG